MNALAEVRLVAACAAGFSLLPIPDLASSKGAEHLMVDVEVLSPDRLVRYLQRIVSTAFVRELAHAWLQCASHSLPEATVATVQDAHAGLAFTVTESTPLGVTVQFIVVDDPQAAVREDDGVEFTVSRAALIDAGHALQRWCA